MNEMLFLFAHNCIEDLKSNHRGRISFVKVNLTNLRESYRKKWKGFDYLEIDRIINRLHTNDLDGTITMFREMQESLINKLKKDRTLLPAINDYLDWKRDVAK